MLLKITVCGFLVFVHVQGIPIAEDDAQMRTFVDLSYLGERIFGNPSIETGKRLQQWDPVTSNLNPEELGEYAEGDILFPRDSRNGLIGETFRWRDGVIPYEIGGYYPPDDKAVIMKAMDIYHKYTCIQ